jgi:predicted Zn-dependent protease
MASTMNKRLTMLEKLTASPQADSFAFYCLAMEYRKEGRVDDALAAFGTLRDKDAGYLAMYLMAGQTLREAARLSDAASWLKQGIELAQQKQDSKALGELESELATVQAG